MDSTPFTLNQFFFSEEELSPEQRSKIESSKTMSSLKKRLLKEAGVKWPAFFGTVLEKLREVLDIKILDIMVPAWHKYQILLKYLDKEKYPPSETFLVALAEHTLKSEHRPFVEILINDQPVGKIDFNIVISLALKGIILKIRDAKIKEVMIGTCTGQGTIECGDLVIVEKKTEPVSFPGSIKLGEGIPIVP